MRVRLNDVRNACTCGNGVSSDCACLVEAGGRRPEVIVQWEYRENSTVGSTGRIIQWGVQGE